MSEPSILTSLSTQPLECKVVVTKLHGMLYFYIIWQMRCLTVSFDSNILVYCLDFVQNITPVVRCKIEVGLHWNSDWTLLSFVFWNHVILRLLFQQYKVLDLPSSLSCFDCKCLVSVKSHWIVLEIRLHIVTLWKSKQDIYHHSFHILTLVLSLTFYSCWSFVIPWVHEQSVLVI